MSNIRVCFKELLKSTDLESAKSTHCIAVNSEDGFCLFQVNICCSAGDFAPGSRGYDSFSLSSPFLLVNRPSARSFPGSIEAFAKQAFTGRLSPCLPARSQTPSDLSRSLQKTTSIPF